MLHFRSIPIIGQYAECRAQHHSAALLEFGFVFLASILPVAIVSLVDIAAGAIKTPYDWTARFAPELAIALSVIVAPLMYYFVSAARQSVSGERTDYPHKGSLQLFCLAVFSAGMMLYVVFASLQFFRRDAADAIKGLFCSVGTGVYVISLLVAYTAILFRNFAENIELEDPDKGVESVLSQLQGGGA